MNNWVLVGAVALGGLVWFSTRQRPATGNQPATDPFIDLADPVYMNFLDWQPIFGATGMADKTLPRGIRNKNPLNIRYFSAINWQGQLGDDGEGYAVFESLFYGLRAAAKDLDTKRKRGLNTIGKIIPIWAPHEDNNPVENYIAFVERETGIKRYEYLMPFDYVNVIRAMAKFENGGDYIDNDQIREGLKAGGIL